MPNVNPVKGLLQAGRSMIEKSKDYGYVELSHPWAFKDSKLFNAVNYVFWTTKT